MLYKSIIGSNDPGGEPPPANPSEDRAFKFIGLAMIVLVVLALLYGCAANHAPIEPLLEHRDVVSKVVDPAGSFWEPYKKFGEAAGTGFILVDKWGYACQVQQREYIQAEEGRAFACQWRRPRKLW